MKTLRICLLVFLTLLLPVRGALAAAMLCPMNAPATTSTEAEAHHAAMGHTMPAHHGGAEQAGTPDACNLCCDFCAVTPLANSLPALPSAQEHSTLSFPDPGAAAPSFVSDGQERPPRST